MNALISVTSLIRSSRLGLFVVKTLNGMFAKSHLAFRKHTVQRFHYKPGHASQVTWVMSHVLQSPVGHTGYRSLQMTKCPLQAIISKTETRRPADISF